MFGLFKKKRDFKTDVALMKAIFSRLEDFGEIRKQIDEGIIIGVSSPYDTWWPNFVKFSLNNELLNKYEDKLRPTFTIMGITVFDSKSAVTTEIQIEIWHGIITGFEPQISKLESPDFETINTSGYWIEYSDQSEFEPIKKLLTEEEIKLINPNEVYELELKGKSYYHIAELDNSDFIGMDLDKKIYKITHDPYEIVELQDSLKEILENLDRYIE
jgi:hypothetical protein